MANTTETSTLFPILQAQTGLARLATESEHVDAGHDIDFRSLDARSILNRSVSKRLQWMVWSINPYRGCEFACRYCYARYTHDFMTSPDAPPDPQSFERTIYVKNNAAWLLEQELRKLAKAGRLGEEIALGTATDPWQPIERRAQVTRGLLQVMAQRSGLRLGVVTKSTLIERDIDLLQQINRNSTLVIHVTITTMDADLARKLEPRAPRPDLRLQTVARLRAVGLRAGILNSPLLPGITDTPEAIDNMAMHAKRADASFFAAMPLFLKACSRPTYFDFVREHFPHLQTLYTERFRDMDFAARPYRERLRALVTASCRRHDLRERLTDTLLTRDAGEPKKPSASAPAHTPAQASLFAGR